MKETKFKQTEIGLIPEDWEVSILENCVGIIKKSIIPLNKEEELFHLYSVPACDESKTPEILKGKEIKSSKFLVEKDMILFPKLNLRFKRIWRINQTSKNSICSTEFFPIKTGPKLSTDFLYYLFQSPLVIDKLQKTASGTSGSHQRIKIDSLKNLSIPLPPLPEQRAIAKILSDLDAKIESNVKQVEILEKMGFLLFKEKVLQLNEYEESSLDQIANYLNGLALQKYPPKGENDLPVIKIRELKQGITDVTDLANSDIPEEYVVNDGDILFSWSGSLEVVIWCEGKGALNQHLFKVTSDKYPKWFYYYWTLHHLKQFKRIAEDKATTMGHIKRKHLSEAKVLIPTKEKLEELNKIFNPIIEKQIMLKVQTRTLARTRDLLLPKLMTGKIRVPVGVEKYEQTRIN